MSESSEDLRDELMSTDEAQNGVRNSPSPIYFSPPKVVHKRKMQYMTASPSGKKKKRSQLEDAGMNGMSHKSFNHVHISVIKCGYS